jgi:two-component system, sensor histidine kinase ChiS
MAENRFLTGKKILVADDNPVVLRAVSMMLMTSGHEVFLALDGTEVISCVRQHKPDLILLDIFFPPSSAGGVIWDGFLILEWLRNLGQAENIPVIIISSAEPAKYKDRCLAAGARAYFQKPLPHKELLESVQAMLNISPHATAAKV